MNNSFDNLGSNNSIAIGERNVVSGDYSIVIGKDITTSESKKLIVKFNPLSIGISPQVIPEINIDETLSEREHYLISSALKAALYLNDVNRMYIKSKGITGVEKMEIPKPEPDAVYKFCKDNDIGVDWDFSYRIMKNWNDILFKDKRIFQITRGITLSQFFNVISTLKKNMDADYFEDDGCAFDIWITDDKELLKEFINQDIFKTCI